MARKGAPNGRCTVCAHPERGRIDYLLATGQPAMALAKQFGLSNHALGRHFKAHVSERFIQAAKVGPFESEERLRALVAQSGTSVIENLRAAQAGIISRWLRAMEAGDDHHFVALTKTLHENLRMQAQMTRELAPHGPSVVVNNTVISGDWLADFGRDLMELGKAHPEIRPALVAMLKRRIGGDAEPELRNITPALEPAHA